MSRDLGRITSGNEVRWIANCEQCDWKVDGFTHRKAFVIRSSRKHLRDEPSHGSIRLSGIVHQQIRAIA